MDYYIENKKNQSDTGVEAHGVESYNKVVCEKIHGFYQPVDSMTFQYLFQHQRP